MRLIIGGTGQGKLAYARSLSENPCMKVLEATLLAERTPEELKGADCLNHLQHLVREIPDPARLKELLERFLSVNEDVIILCDEVGCGVVPMQKEERDYREAVGRLCIGLAARAETVDRVTAGIGLRIKPPV